MKKFNCPFCEETMVDLDGMHHHLEEDHEDNIPKNESSAEFYYSIRTGKTHGNCVVCKNKTDWNPSTNKYHRFCNRPACKESYIEEFKKRMIGKHGKTSLLNDPEHQKKMLANRSISGEYKWSDGKIKTYTGSYEKDFLQFLDVFLEFDSADVFAPSPHTYYYEYEGRQHFYIPDFFIASLNLEIEVKDGGSNPNNHGKIQRVDKVKEKRKDDVLASQKDYDYIKVVNKEYGNFVDYLLQRKKDFQDNMQTVTESAQETYLTASDVLPNSVGVTESVIDELFGDNISLGKYALLSQKLDDEYNYDNLKLPSHEVYRDCWDCSRSILMNDPFTRTDTPVSLDTFKNAFGIIIPTTNWALRIVLESIKAGENNVEARENFRKELTNLLSQIDNPDELKVVRRDAIVSHCLLFNTLRECGEIGTSYIPLYNWLGRDYMKQLDAYEIDHYGTCSDPEVSELTTVLEQDMYKAKDGRELIPVYVLLTHSGTVLANAIKTVTQNPYSHSSISFDPELENMYSFGRKYKSNPLIGTFVRESIKEGLYEEVANRATYSLYVTFVTQEEFTRMQDKLNEFKQPDQKFKYNFVGLIRHQFGMTTNREDAYFCSEFVNTILTAGGTDYMGKHSSLVKPYDFAKNKHFHFVTKGLLNFYDPKKVKDMVDAIADRNL